MAQFGVRMWRHRSRRLDRLPNKIRANPRRKPLGPPVSFPATSGFSFRDLGAGAAVEERMDALRERNKG